ncbi:MAG: pre-peptidase C-terminal domain-containing protein [Armatimonadetes bacterium]|nr:pre-peptidase C-terminal domain-containing protein [Armatimonadota bacterium]
MKRFNRILPLIAASLVMNGAFAVLTEQEPNDDSSQAQVITPAGFPWTDSGTFAFDFAGDNDWFKIPLQAGQNIRVTTNVTGCGTDTVVAIINPAADTVLAFNDDFSGLSSQVSYNVTADGDYYIAVTGYHGGGQNVVSYYTGVHTNAGCYGFQIELRSAPPQMNLLDGATRWQMSEAAISSAANRTGAGGGLGTYDDGQDHLFQYWHWYRTSASTREHAMSTLTGGNNPAQNEANLTYTEPDGVTFDTNWVLHEMGIDSFSFAPRSYMMVTVTATNTTVDPMTLDLFSYLDYDMNASVGGDSAELVTPTWTRITDISFGGHHASSPPSHWQIGAFATVRNVLTDAFVSNLSDSGSPFGPGDYTGAYQHTMGLGGGLLGAGASASVSYIVSMNMGVPGDVDANGCVDDTDLATVLSLFGLTSFDFGYDENADFNRDGIIDDTDLAIALQFFGFGC